MTKSIEVWNGMLRLADDATLDNTIKSLINKNETELVDWSNSLGFHSLYANNLKFRNSKSAYNDDLFPESDLEFISDPHFASILNEKGEIMINDLKVKVTRDIIFLFRIENSHIVENLSFEQVYSKTNYDSLTEIHNGIWAGKVSRQNSSFEANNGRLKSGNRSEMHHFFNSNRRFAAVTWNENYFIFASVGTKTKNQNKNAGIWWRNKAEYLKMTINYHYIFKSGSGATLDIPVSGLVISENNSGKVKFIVDWATMKIKYHSKKGLGSEPPKPFKMKYFNVRHEVKDNNSVGIVHTSL